MRFFYLLIAMFCLPGCVSATSAPEIITGEILLDETFDLRGDWSLYATDAVTATVTDGTYQMLLEQPDQYVWGTTNVRFDNTAVEVDVTWLSDNPTAFAGVICRLNTQSNTGYYLVVSQGGDFSIRMIGRNTDEAIVTWRRHPRIPQSGTFRVGVVCVDNFIGLYINGEYVDGGYDNRLSQGQVGLTTGMPRTISGDGTSFVVFDNLVVRDAFLR